MTRKSFLVALMTVALGTLLFRAGALAAPPEPFTNSWDISMSDPVGHAGVGTLNPCVNDGLGILNQYDCPDVHNYVWLQPGGGAAAEDFLDVATTTWTTGSKGVDKTGDGVGDPTKGLAVNKPTTLGAKAGTIAFYITSNLNVTTHGLNGGIDDIGSNQDATVSGQPPTCGTGTPVQAEMEIWVSSVSAAPTVAVTDTDPVPDGIAESQEPDPAGPGAPDKAPKAVSAMPEPIPTLVADVGLSMSDLMTRAYGIAPVKIGIFVNPTDVNFLVFDLVSDPTVGGFVTMTMVQYQGGEAEVPVSGQTQTNQTAKTCSPFWTHVTTGGVTANSDFPPNVGNDLTVTREKNRQIIGSSGTFDYYINLSVGEDIDNDGIANSFDRCETDATTNVDADGDTLAGTCDSNDSSNPGPFKSSPPWSTGQDVDGDTFVNDSDNCPTVANGSGADIQDDTDRDGIGDACEKTVPAKTIRGDALGWPTQGTFYNASNRCVDQFTLGTSEPTAEAASATGKYCIADNTVATVLNPSGYPGNPKMAKKIDWLYRDSDDDGDPDYIAAVKLYDTDSDSDSDGHSDACETYGMTKTVLPASNALNASVIPTTVMPDAPGAPVAGDCDKDGLTDVVEEENRKTNPFDADTDNDGLLDGAECPSAPPAACATNPLKKDTDNDGLTDKEEKAPPDGLCNPACDPKDSDSDDDGFMDGFDLYLDGGFGSGLNCDPANPTAAAPKTAAPGDGDADGLKAYYECYLWLNEAGGNNLTDVDKDGCFPSEEQALNFKEGVDDFMDVFTKVNADPTANGDPPDKAMSLLDVLAILKYVPSPPPGGGTLDTPNVNGVAYNSLKQGDLDGDTSVALPGDATGKVYDGSLSAVPNPPFDAGVANQAISLSDDVLTALGAVQPTNCAGAPN